MPSNNTTEQEVIALFPDNNTHEISAADMRAYVSAIFSDKETTIVKIQYLADLASSNANIYEGTVVVIWGDESAYNGLYLSKINQPTLVSELVKLSGLIENPEDLINPLFTYDYSTYSNLLVQTDTYTEIARLTTIPRVQGTYEIKMSMMYSYSSNVRSAYFRWSEDGGDNWMEVIYEPKDITSMLPQAFHHIDVSAGGIKDIVIEARCSDAGDTITIPMLEIIYQRVA